MRKIVVVGGSKGIGHAIVQSLIEENIVVNISRTAPLQPHANLTHYNCDILTDDLPEFLKNYMVLFIVLEALI